MKMIAIATLFLLVSSTSVFAGSLTDKGDMTEDQAIEAVEKEMAENPTAAGPSTTPVTEGEVVEKAKEEMDDLASKKASDLAEEEPAKPKADY